MTGPLVYVRTTKIQDVNSGVVYNPSDILIHPDKAHPLTGSVGGDHTYQYCNLYGSDTVKNEIIAIPFNPFSGSVNGNDTVIAGINYPVTFPISVSRGYSTPPLELAIFHPSVENVDIIAAVVSGQGVDCRGLFGSTNALGVAFLGDLAFVSDGTHIETFRISVTVGSILVNGVSTPTYAYAKTSLSVFTGGVTSPGSLVIFNGCLVAADSNSLSVSVYSINSSSGAVAFLASRPAETSSTPPMFLAAGSDYLYVGISNATPSINSYTLNNATGVLSLVDTVYTVSTALTVNVGGGGSSVTKVHIGGLAVDGGFLYASMTAIASIETYFAKVSGSISGLESPDTVLSYGDGLGFLDSQESPDTLSSILDYGIAYGNLVIQEDSDTETASGSTTGKFLYVFLESPRQVFWVTQTENAEIDSPRLCKFTFARLDTPRATLFTLTGQLDTSRYSIWTLGTTQFYNIFYPGGLH